MDEIEKNMIPGWNDGLLNDQFISYTPLIHFFKKATRSVEDQSFSMSLYFELNSWTSGRCCKTCFELNIENLGKV